MDIFRFCHCFAHQDRSDLTTAVLEEETKQQLLLGFLCASIVFFAWFLVCIHCVFSGIALVLCLDVTLLQDLGVKLAFSDKVSREKEKLSAVLENFHPFNCVNYYLICCCFLRSQLWQGRLSVYTQQSLNNLQVLQEILSVAAEQRFAQQEKRKLGHKKKTIFVIAGGETSLELKDFDELGVSCELKFTLPVIPAARLLLASRRNQDNQAFLCLPFGSPLCIRDSKWMWQRHATRFRGSVTWSFLLQNHGF